MALEHREANGSTIFDISSVGFYEVCSKEKDKTIAPYSYVHLCFCLLIPGAGLRYEHVKFSMSTSIGQVQLSLNYTGKTKRPNYSDLDGTIDYIVWCNGRTQSTFPAIYG